MKAAIFCSVAFSRRMPLIPKSRSLSLPLSLSLSLSLVHEADTRSLRSFRFLWPLDSGNADDFFHSASLSLSLSMKELSLRRFAALSAAFLRVGLCLDLLPASQIQQIQGLGADR